jgi:hypothetical protein
MKKSKIFVVAGAALLAISAVFASKANKKFGSITTAANSALTYYVIAGDLFTTATGGNLLQPVVKLVTAGTSHSTIVSLGALIDPSNDDNALMPSTDF